MITKRTVLVAGLLGLGIALTGCGLGEALEKETASYDVTDKVAALRVQTDSGTIEVVESDRQGIHVTEKLSWRKHRPKTTHEVKGDTLQLVFTCPVQSGFWTACDVAYEVEVPRGVRVEAESDSGTLTLKSLSGTLDATTDSGSINATGLTGKKAVARTDSGTVSLSFEGQPDRVEMATDSGSSALHVPGGPYKITTSTDSGSKDISTANDPAAPRTIDVTTESGSIEISTP